MRDIQSGAAQMAIAADSAELGKRTAGSGEGIHMPAEKREREREGE
jgi:hypothetical protein